MKKLFIALLVIGLSFGIAFADEDPASDKSVEERIIELEQQVERLTKENKDLQKQVLEKEVQLRSSLANERWAIEENQVLRNWLNDKKQNEKRIITNEAVENLKEFNKKEDDSK